MNSSKSKNVYYLINSAHAAQIIIRFHLFIQIGDYLFKKTSYFIVIRILSSLSQLCLYYCYYFEIFVLFTSNISLKLIEIDFDLYVRRCDMCTLRK